MSEIEFSNNYRDLCDSFGTGAGFQFEFYCQECSDLWRSRFQPYQAGRASGWLSQAGSLAGGLFNNLGIDRAVDGFAEQGWGRAKDAALQEAVAEARAHFHRCASCNHHVCDNCWNASAGQCTNCMPDLAAHTERSRHSGRLDAVRERAYEAGQMLAGSDDVTTAVQSECPQCRAQTRGGRFCPECGHQLATPPVCRACSAPLPETGRFCPGCGAGR